MAPAQIRRYHTGTVIVGGGLAGIVTALELIDRGRHVVLLERTATVGGLAAQAFGGMHLVDTPLQRRMGIRDDGELALADWHRFAEFDASDEWPHRWAQLYIERCVPDIYEWVRAHGVRFVPAVLWAERGWYQPGNSVPRYHVVWGTGQHLTARLLAALDSQRRRDALITLTGHRVTGLEVSNGVVKGCHGQADDGTPFSVEADQVVIAAGGITGNLDLVRRHWPAGWGLPSTLLNGSHPAADGSLHAEVAASGGRITHLDRMWNYAAGVHHPQAEFAGHGLSLIPCRSALWMDAHGRRIGPEPLVTGFDTRHLVEQVSRAGTPHTWQILNRRIACRELAVSGAAHNPELRDRRPLGFVLRSLLGNAPLVDRMCGECEDFVVAPTLPELAAAMNRLTGDNAIDAGTLEQEIRAYDARIARGPRYHNDDQLRRIEHLRRWPGDRIRTCAYQRIVDPAAGPLIAIRTFVLTRKTLGGMQTDLSGRVLNTEGIPIAGLYAVGEAAGFGGGGASGKRSLEGTCLSGCILTARRAAQAIS